MPLQGDYGESFVNVSVVYTGSDDNNVDLRDGPDFRVRLPEAFSHVVGLEMQKFQVPVASLSQFTDADKIDFRLRNPVIYGGAWKTFTATLPISQVVYDSPSQPDSDLLTDLYQAFLEVLLKDPDFGSKADVVPITDPQQRTRLVCRTLVFPPLATWPGHDSTECELLFGSGPNRAASAGPVLGFEAADLAMAPATIYGVPFRQAISQAPAQINRFRYIDIFVDEVPELRPFHRIYTPVVSSKALTLQESASRLRFLTEPVRRLETLTVRPRLPGGLRPSTSYPFYFSFRVFELKSANELPEKEKRRINVL